MGYCEEDDERSASIKGQTFLDYLSDYQLLKSDCAQWSVAVGSIQAEEKVLASL
jgi:hypothetical protein